MKLTKSFKPGPVALFATVAVATLSTLGGVTQAHAKITAFLSAGATCEGTPSASFTAGGPTVQVSLCITTTVERLCGHTAKLQAAVAAENGRFHVTAVTRGHNYSDPNGEPTYPLAITNPPAITDFGATVSRAAVGPAAKQLLVTFDLSPLVNATEATYTINLAPISSVGVSADGACTLPADAPIAASFALIQRSGSQGRQ